MFERTPRFAEFVRRAYGEDELVPPGIVLDSVETSPELRYLAGEILFAEHQTLSAQGVGINGGLSINNPKGSSVIAVITRVINHDATNNVSLQVNRNSQGTGATVSIHTMDARARRFSFLKIGSKIVGAATNDGGAILVRPSQASLPGTNILDVKITLVPNSHLLIENTGANAVTDVQFEGYERPATAEELSVE